MFTGIVQGVAEIVAVEGRGDLVTHTERFPAEMLAGLALGASVAHNGCCLTVTRVEGDLVSFDLMQETLRLTNLAGLKPGARLNIERAARFGDEIGGHVMSGHIACQARVVEILETDTNYTLWLELPAAYAKYVLAKGFIGVDGASLTIGEVRGPRFALHLIPETLARTTIRERGVGSLVNIEIDAQTQAIVDTTERVLALRADRA